MLFHTVASLLTSRKFWAASMFLIDRQTPSAPAGHSGTPSLHSLPRSASCVDDGLDGHPTLNPFVISVNEDRSPALSTRVTAWCRAMIGVWSFQPSSRSSHGQRIGDRSWAGIYMRPKQRLYGDMLWVFHGRFPLVLQEPSNVYNGVSLSPHADCSSNHRRIGNE